MAQELNEVKVVRSENKIQVLLASTYDAMASLNLVDVLGRVILSKEIEITSGIPQVIDLNVRESGQVYILKVTTSSGLGYTGKLMH